MKNTVHSTPLVSPAEIASALIEQSATYGTRGDVFNFFPALDDGEVPGIFPLWPLLLILLILAGLLVLSSS